MSTFGSSEQMNPSEMGRKGGEATKRKHPDHFKKMALKRWASREQSKENRVA